MEPFLKSIKKRKGGGGRRDEEKGGEERGKWGRESKGR